METVADRPGVGQPFRAAQAFDKDQPGPRDHAQDKHKASPYKRTTAGEGTGFCSSAWEICHV
ncbi:hypothetical protein DBR45_08745 [Pseudomonas sp. HMWF031]|nr:hypothetical protein DBR45_08745 [Pseudomonas sp. HMWF031]